ncbi:DUF3052 domain-containing protein [Corynebacterium sp. 153RC1]|uniref:DUF3052 domain-containing protein n=1 Tax=unclassified Corynebacterium TaxID=2624378 RepID=UPI00211BA049|nr:MULTISPECIES: DUF3052 domain-containing protein [unclassified Corynebacterium]MCQ9352327.1 DUF3052 domain-containing protein [Corynebacterium sp. 209RC1]MCQ9354283.1 DUF3052 domain-containing protein [Corynebacterium sp. 1222RC1]MCQ9356565.1 DUF3052 domain-containing protein [Corynebacterium sp. 122RC1]MCQ9358851.1 DUF3052 domain-containing protein [Corynebacterium sp. 142RC1]MCQ9360517.1 DUF3052 domain-containing protein [Corynebacterium sp. 153RC1]
MNAQRNKEKSSVEDLAHRLGVREGLLVQEVGWDEDADSSISEAIEDIIGSELLDEDTDEACDIVLLWWREDDGDLVDGLVDAVRPLADAGRIWLLTPGAGRSGALEPGEIAESAQLAGLVQTRAERLGNWQGSCLVQRSGK